MPFLLAEILNFQGSTHLMGVGSFSLLYMELGVALGKPKQEICKTIIDYIDQSKQGD